MQTKPLARGLSLLAAFTTLHLLPSTGFAQATAFTYQGRLTEGPNPVDGSYDLRFALFNAASNGTQQGVTITNAATALSNGLFTVTLDFGNQFPGASRWLEIGVRTNGGGTFSTLEPRHPLTATPYAVQAANANTAGTAATATTAMSANSVAASNLTGTLPDSILSTNVARRSGGNVFSGNQSVTSGSVGIGTTSPTAALDVNGTARATSFAGDGSELTSLNASQLDAGTVPDGRLSPGIARTHQVWSLNGNAGTTPDVNFLGTSDNQPLELRVNGARAFRLEAVANSFGNTNLVNVIGGSSNNFVANGIRGATIGGGGALRFNTDPAMTNTIREDMGTIGGGAGNTVAVNARGGTIAGGIQNWLGATYATIAGGYQNTNSGQHSAIGGGYQNVVGDTGTVAGGQKNAASGFGAAVGGGVLNVAAGDRSFVGCGWQNDVQSQYGTISGGSVNFISITASGAAIGGGTQNFVSGPYATVPGGFFNAASGDFSFAAGRQAKVYHQSSFVWADSPNGSGLDFASTSTNQFLIRASGGVGIGTNSPAAALHVVGNILATGTVTGSSDRNLKRDLVPVDVREMLDKVVTLPISTWSYIAEDGVRHLGPMAQDFHAAFNVGLNDKTISMVDADGVALSAIQGLNNKVESRTQRAETRMEKLEAENAALKRELAEIRQLLTQLATRQN